MDPVSTKARHLSSPTTMSVSLAWPSRSHMGLFDESNDDDVVDDDVDDEVTSCCPSEEVTARLKTSASCSYMPDLYAP